jgi:esterase/lipase superfamily enzyme
MEVNVSRPLLFILGVLALGAGAAQAQPSQAVSMIEECRPSANETLESLQTRKLVVERALEQERKRAETTKTAKPTPNLRKAQEDMIDVVFQIECLNRLQPEMQKRGVAKRSVGSGGVKKDVVEITTYYATNRNRVAGAEPVNSYGSDFLGKFEYGRAVVSIPITHRVGEIETPKLWKLELQADPNKHFVLKSVTPLALDAARTEMAEKMRTSGSPAVLLFVHGYNSGFGDAAMRAAQLAYDLKFPGMPFFYSWPSANRVRAYLPDEETARLSESVFENLIEDLTTQLPVKDIYIVAHSMGTRVVSHALQHRAESGKPNKQLRELLLAAPDINAELFKEQIAPKLASMQGLRTTVYASSGDLALRVSKIVHGFQRVGETTGGVLTFPGLETIDASSASSSSRSFGHSYIVDTPSVLGDIKSIILSKASTSQRGLSVAGTSPNTYWKLVPGNN